MPHVYALEQTIIFTFSHEKKNKKKTKKKERKKPRVHTVQILHSIPIIRGVTIMRFLAGNRREMKSFSGGRTEHTRYTLCVIIMCVCYIILYAFTCSVVTRSVCERVKGGFFLACEFALDNAMALRGNFQSHRTRDCESKKRLVATTGV